jgi:HlyD family secretion protein
MLKNYKKVIWYGILVGILGIILFLLKDYMSPYNELEGIASGNGRIETTQVNITAKYGGRVMNVYVQEGDMVEKGQLLTKLDTKELKAQLMVALAGVEQAKESKKYAEAIVLQKESDFKQKEKNYLRSKSLFESKSISLFNFEQDETAFRVSSAGLDAAKAQVTSYEAAIHAAQAQVETIEVQIEERNLYAPVSGRVLYRLVEEGEMIASGGKALVVLDLIDTYMTIFLPTSQVGLIDIGSQARIVLDALPNVSIPARVSFISPEAQFTPKEIETASEREKLMFRVKVKIDASLLQNHMEKIKTGLPGMTYIRLDSSLPWPAMLSHVPKSEHKAR